MKISFLVTFYQQKQYVAQSLDRILALDKPPEWELLIGDDGSTDGTADLIQQYVKRDPEHVRFFIMPRDPGRKYTPLERASANRLNLVRHASGDCYCLQDGDDFYSETDFIPSALAVLEAQPEVAVVAFDTWMYREGGPERAPQPKRAEPVPMPRERYLRWRYTHAGACVYRNLHTPENLALLEQLNDFDDNEIILNALTLGTMVRIPRPVYAYRQAIPSLYSIMKPTERAALNLAGMGVALRVMGPKWERAVTARFATAVLMAWILRKRTALDIPPSKMETYLGICRRAGFAEGEQLLLWSDQSEEIRRKLRRWVCRAALESPPRVFYAWTQVYLRRVPS